MPVNKKPAAKSKKTTVKSKKATDPVLERLKKSYPKYKVTKQEPKYSSSTHPSKRTKKPSYYITHPSGQQSKITPGAKSKTKSYTTKQLVQMKLNNK